MLTKKYIPIKLHKYNHFCHPFLYVYITTFSLFCKLYTFTNVLNILYFSKVFGKIPESNIKNYSYYFIHYEEKQTKKEILPYPICSVVAVFKMLIRILNMLRSRIWDRGVVLFSDYPKSTVDKNGDSSYSSGQSPSLSKTND